MTFYNFSKINHLLSHLLTQSLTHKVTYTIRWSRIKRIVEMFFIRVYHKMIFLGWIKSWELGCTINDIFGLDKKWVIGNSDYVMLFSWHSQKIIY